MNKYELKELKMTYDVNDDDINTIYNKYNDIIIDNKNKIYDYIEKITLLNERFNHNPYSVIINYNNTDNTDKNIYNILKTHRHSVNILDKIKREYNDYTLDHSYHIVKKRTNDYNKHSNKELQELMGTTGKPYGIVVYDFTELDISNYLVSANPYKLKSGRITKTLTFNLQYSGSYNEFDETIKDINDEIKDILKDCYDNEIIFDLGYDKILVISQLPMYKYFNLIENNKNTFYEVKVFSYDDNRYYKYIYKNKDDDDRVEYELLNDLDYDGK
jgi:hypothetical protein